jgi:hypothetical protein
VPKWQSIAAYCSLLQLLGKASTCRLAAELGVGLFGSKKIGPDVDIPGLRAPEDLFRSRTGAPHKQYEEGRSGGKQESPEPDSLDDHVEMVAVRGRDEGRCTIDLHEVDIYNMRTFAVSSKASREDFCEFWSKPLRCLGKKGGKKKARVTLRVFRLTDVQRSKSAAVRRRRNQTACDRGLAVSRWSCLR